jgi:hypothetical protein
MPLPGGVPRDGRLRRDYRFCPLTGVQERILADSGYRAEHLPQQVTSVLAGSLAELAGVTADEGLVRSLSCGDREYLVLQLAALIDPAPRWVTAGCRGCSELIQFQVSPQAVPFKPSGEGYPETVAELSIGEARLRVPTGADEEFIAVQESDAGAETLLLSRLLTFAGEPVPVECLSRVDLEQLDQLLDRMSPQAGLSAGVDCPHCGLSQEMRIDPYDWLLGDSDALDQEIHTLAFHYHWSEQDILALPRTRRARYLQLIDRSLGKYRADDLIQGSHGGRW